MSRPIVVPNATLSNPLPITVKESVKNLSVLTVHRITHGSLTTLIMEPDNKVAWHHHIIHLKTEASPATMNVVRCKLRNGKVEMDEGMAF